MKDFPTQKQYLKQAKELNQFVDITQLKRDYKKAYHREYNQRRIGYKKLTIRLTNKEYKKLISLKKDYTNYSLNKLIIESVISYQEHKYLPHNPEETRKLIVSIDKIGNNVNQVVHKMHLSSLRLNSEIGTIETDKKNLHRILKGYKIMGDQLKELKKSLEAYLRQPNHKLINLDWEEIRYDKIKIKRLIQHLEDHLCSL